VNIGDLVRWKRYDHEEDLKPNDLGVVITLEQWANIDDPALIIGVQFSRCGFVWCNPKSLELIISKD